MNTLDRLEMEIPYNIAGISSCEIFIKYVTYSLHFIPCAGHVCATCLPCIFRIRR